jgi:predicted aspartyl protease
LIAALVEPCRTAVIVALSTGLRCSELLRQLGVDVKVQQELLRHADVRTTLNVYTQAVSEQKRSAHSSVVRIVLPAKMAVQSQATGHFWTSKAR